MKLLSLSEQNNLLSYCMQSCGMSFDSVDRMNAFEKAANKFNLKIKKRLKGTYHEEISLTTNYNNCDQVREFISSLNVSVPIISGVIKFYPNK